MQIKNIILIINSKVFDLNLFAERARRQESESTMNLLRNKKKVNLRDLMITKHLAVKEKVVERRLLKKKTQKSEKNKKNPADIEKPVLSVKTKIKFGKVL